MKTPICDFVKQYASQDMLRLHMPGHKGIGPLGCERLDITEIRGADSLYEAEGIIRESEENAGALFGCPTFYATEGSSQCIRAMLHLAALAARKPGQKLRIAAARNVHKTFLSAAALLDFEVVWLYPEKTNSYLACHVSSQTLEAVLRDAQGSIGAVYLTSPDYLGNLADVASISAVCRKYGALLLVDNAHGAYLRFLPESLHPMDLGADLCCDSAHKTLPVLTGGAYLHIRDAKLALQAKNALMLFGSTSPSYLILQSLDAANAYLAADYRQKLAGFIKHTDACRERLMSHGYVLCSHEPLKITLSTKPYGYEGNGFARLLREKRIECEFSDPDFVVLMLTPEIGIHGLERLENALLSIPKSAPIQSAPPKIPACPQVVSIRQAMLSPARTLPAGECVGRILASAGVGCPPAVPIVTCGERITPEAAEMFRYYAVETCSVVSE